jgi:hypothetical protein
LFVCIKFGEEFSGWRFHGAWTEANSGGTPLSNTEKANKLWADNPQYLMEIKKDARVFISLGQPDQRLVPGEVYPFSNFSLPPPLTLSEKLRKSMISIWKLEEGECHLDIFDRKRKPKMTTIKEYRE